MSEMWITLWKLITTIKIEVPNIFFSCVIKFSILFIYYLYIDCKNCSGVCHFLKWGMSFFAVGMSFFAVCQNLQWVCHFLQYVKICSGYVIFCSMSKFALGFIIWL